MAITTQFQKAMSHNKEPCKISAFPGGDPASTQIGYQVIDIEDRKEVRTNGELLPAKDARVLQIQAIWAALLQLYTNAKDVCFASIEENGITNIKSCCIQRYHTIQTVALCLAPSQNHINQTYQSLASLYNTAAIFSSGNWSPQIQLADGIDLALEICLKHAGVYAYRIAYRRKLVAKPEARNVAETFKHIANQSKHNPNQPVSGIGPSPWDIRNLQEWNAAKPLRKYERLVQHMFQDVAKTHSKHIAIDAWDARMTYNDLDQRSTNVAKYLISKGVTPGSWMILCSISRPGQWLLGDRKLSASLQNSVVLIGVLLLSQPTVWAVFQTPSLFGRGVRIDGVNVKGSEGEMGGCESFKSIRTNWE
jgi:hypothetical protein